METHLTDQFEEPLAAETPEDVAILYSWANLHGAKYRDFSASRREYRAQVRHRAAEEMRLGELKAQADAERAAADAEQAARDAEHAARQGEGFNDPYSREQALRDADEAARRASAERVEAARRAEAAAMAEAQARREEREIAEAHASAQRQAARYADSEIRRRSLAGPQPVPVPGLASDPYEPVAGAIEGDPFNGQTLSSAERRAYRDQQEASGDRLAARGYEGARGSEYEQRRRPQGFQPDEASGVRAAFTGSPIRANDVRNRRSGGRYDQASPYWNDGAQPYPQTPLDDQRAPAWLQENPGAAPQGAPNASVSDSLQHSRERVAARWYALKGVFDPAEEGRLEAAAVRRDTRTPLLAVFSLAGGVGKTSMVATLGRTLSSLGEKVLLADTTSHGLLPFYFGASELRPGVVRTFSPPSGSSDAPIHLVSFDIDQRGGDRTSQDGVAEEIANAANGTQRVLLDLNASSGWLIRRLARMNPTVLVPVAPDMNSVISLQAVERFFHGVTDNDGRQVQPFYLLNQFDAALPLHLDVREVLRRQLGDRLLPYVIRRSPSVSEALAEGMTVVDYAPDAAAAGDYLSVANWLRTVSAPTTQGNRNARWSER